MADAIVDGVRKIADDLMFRLCKQPLSGMLAAASRIACKDTDIIDMSTGRTHDEDLGALIYKDMSEAYWICNTEVVESVNSTRPSNLRILQERV